MLHSLYEAKIFVFYLDRRGFGGRSSASFGELRHMISTFGLTSTVCTWDVIFCLVRPFCQLYEEFSAGVNFVRRMVLIFGLSFKGLFIFGLSKHSIFRDFQKNVLAFQS